MSRNISPGFAAPSLPALCLISAVVLWLESLSFPAVLLPWDRFSLWTYYLVFLLITLSPYLWVTLRQPPPLLFPCCGLDNNRKDLRACKPKPVSDLDDPEVPGSPVHTAACPSPPQAGVTHRPQALRAAENRGLLFGVAQRSRHILAAAAPG